MAQQPTTNGNGGMKRSLRNRHVQMIAIGGTIGTGLFLGSGTTIHRTGPSIILVYAVLGIFFFLMMRALGEMLYEDPNQHTFVSFISKYVGEGAGFFAGWSYWLGLIFLAMAELTAIGRYIQYWFPTWNASLIQLVFLAILTTMNLIAAQVFGETEFWFAMIKIIAILALIFTGIIMILTGFKTPSGSVASFGNILDHFQFFPNGVWKFLGAFPMVFFAFQGIEFVSITIGETANPREVLPKAINQTIYRILIFYIGAMIIIMSINPWREINPQQSPFVQVFALAGLKGAAGVINFVVLTSAASALNSAIFSAGRHLYQIGTEGHSKEDSKVTEISSSGVPARAIFTSSIVMLLAPALAMIPQIKDAFEFITSSSSDLYILVYALAMVAHYRYRHSADYMPDGFKMPGFPFTNIITIIFFVFIFFTLFINADAIIPAVGAIIWTIVFGTISYLKFRKQAAEPGE